MVNYAVRKLLCNLNGVISTTGINNDNVIGPSHRFEGVANVVGFVLGDDDDRHRTHKSPESIKRPLYTFYRFGDNDGI